jgi:hypothetical protein
MRDTIVDTISLKSNYNLSHTMKLKNMSGSPIEISIVMYGKLGILKMLYMEWRTT